jgi:hypothetical protein
LVAGNRMLRERLRDDPPHTSMLYSLEGEFLWCGPGTQSFFDGETEDSRRKCSRRLAAEAHAKSRHGLDADPMLNQADG